MHLISSIAKRIFDIILALMGIVMLWPVYLLIAYLVKRSSPGPVLYRGVRTGLGGKPFKIMKFRTMVANAEKVGGYSTALNDPRLTQIGKKLRKYKLDELPQLFNIIKGEMSFVGPRPQVEAYTKLYNLDEQRILKVRPGLTDYASIQFIDLDSILGDEGVDDKYINEIEPNKNKLRLKYVDEMSFFVDLKIIFSTIFKMLNIQSSWNTHS